MNLEKLTLKSQEVLGKAQELAREYGHQKIEPQHIFHALISDREGIVSTVLLSMEAGIPVLTSETEKAMSSLPRVSGQGVSEPYLSSASQSVLTAAEKEAGKLRDEFVSTEHILIALVVELSAVKTILEQRGVSRDRIYVTLRKLRGNQQVTDQSPESKFQSLDKYGRDLNQLARLGKLDPVIGRDAEIRRVLQVLSRRTKNNPVLIGEPGVGKTAIAEGIALRIVNGDVPEDIRDKRIVALDIGALVAGAKFRGEFEDRLKAVLKEVVESNGRIVLFIDEIHTLVGAGNAEGAVDAANLLKPALARGELRCIGATTLDEYRKYIDKDAALERRFQSVLVAEPKVEDAISILRGLKERYEVHHGVRITDQAIVASVVLADRYIADRFLPDKSIDLIDEAAASMRLEINSVPQELDDIGRKIKQLEIEQLALKKEKDKQSTMRLSELKSELADLKEQHTLLRAHWEIERNGIKQINRLKEEIENTRKQIEQAERDGDLNKAAELKYGVISRLEAELEAEKGKLNEVQRDKKMLKEEVNEEDIAETVAKWTGIPVTRMLESEREKIRRADEKLKERVVGQDEAVQVVADAIKRSRSGLSDENRPIGSFIFLGSTGVGKTECAKALAEFLFDDENAMIRIDMSEYMERHSVARLIGAPPGYVGYEDGGQLSEAVRRRPYCVVLLDEIEKAHPEVFNILLQVLDDGRLTDSQGRVVSFKNTIVIMTSNLGAELIASQIAGITDQNRDDIYDKLKKGVTAELKRALKPEFLNRIDDVVVFRPLTTSDITRIVTLQFETVKNRLAGQGMKAELSQKAITWLVEHGFDPVYGARPLKRLIEKTIINRIAAKILEGAVGSGDHLLIDVEKGDIVILGKKDTKAEVA